MGIDDQTYFILTSNRKSLIAISTLFGLTEEEMNHPNAGEWIVDCIKQVQTAALTYRSIAMRKNDNQKVENYDPSPFTNKPNPLVAAPSPDEKPTP